MKTKLRKLVFFVLFMTVIAPIVLYTDTLGAYLNSSSPSNEFVEAVSSFTFAGDVTPLNVLPQEPSVDLKEPFGLVYSDISANSNGYNASTGESAHNTRQLTGDLAEDGLSNSSPLNSNGSTKQSLGENPIRQVTDKEHDDGKEIGKENSRETESNGDSRSITERNDAKKGVSSLLSHGASEMADKVRRRHPQRSSRASGKYSSEEVRIRAEKLNEHNDFPVLDARIHQLKDQLVQARIYLSLPVTRNNNHFTRDLRLRMKEIQKALAYATKDSDLPRNASEKSKALEQTLLKGKQILDDCAVVEKKLRGMLHSAEEQLRVHRKQAMFLSHLTTQTMPKGLHCLPLRLSTDYFMLNSSQQHFSNHVNLEDPKLYHYALFSDNVLAAAVVVNSTIIHAKDPSKHVFHVVTDRLNYAAMRMWFLANPPGKATIQVQNVEEFRWLNSSYSPVLKELGSASMIDYYFKSRHTDSDPNLKYRNPKYLSIMNHLRFYLPKIFPKLDKILFLDDDIVVQKDLTGLWSLDPKGKVIGVVETCGESFHRFDRYLNFSNPLISKSFTPRACGWAFGMNIVDLDAWRKNNITEVYHKWQNLNRDRQLWKLGTLPPGLITFWNHTYSLDKSWHVLGLGYDPNVPQKDIERAAVIHYNGNLKPWLEIGVPKFRGYWSKYVNYDQVHLRECNITP